MENRGLARINASEAELKEYALNPNRGKIISGEKTQYNTQGVRGQGYPSVRLWRYENRS
jgi:hypothetical protein